MSLNNASYCTIPAVEVGIQVWYTSQIISGVPPTHKATARQVYEQKKRW